VVPAQTTSKGDLSGISQAGGDSPKILARLFYYGSCRNSLSGFLKSATWENSDKLDEAIALFSVGYGDQNEKDFEVFLKGAQPGKFEVHPEAV
jgi:hypothetical protein